MANKTKAPNANASGSAPPKRLGRPLKPELLDLTSEERLRRIQDQKIKSARKKKEAAAAAAFKNASIASFLQVPSLPRDTEQHPVTPVRVSELARENSKS
jgi:hypothetical protein